VTAYILYSAAHGEPDSHTWYRIDRSAWYPESQRERMPSYRLPEPIPHLHDHPTLATLNQVCRSLSLSQKKEVLTAVRVGLAPRHSRRMRKKGAMMAMRRDPVTLLDEYGNKENTITMHDVYYLIDSYLTTPMRRSLLSMALRCSPIKLMDLYLSGSLKPVYTYYVHEDYPPWSSYYDLLLP
jgi:hypothetical protein